jgi:hypothetical protein
MKLHFDHNFIAIGFCRGIVMSSAGNVVVLRGILGSLGGVSSLSDIIWDHAEWRQKRSWEILVVPDFIVGTRPSGERN